MIYKCRAYEVAAIRWKGDNFSEVQSFLTHFVGEPAGLSLRNEKGSYVIAGQKKSYNTLLFYAWHDDQEVDEGRWIVVDLGKQDSGAIFIHDEFTERFEEAEDYGI